MRNFIIRQTILAGLFVFAGYSCAVLAGEIPTNLEPAYTRAVIAFNSGKFDDSLKLLEEVLQAVPQSFNALELKALNQKAKKLDNDALKTYAELIRVGPRERKPKYYFEAGSVLYRAKRYAQARPYLNAAIQGSFNVGASHFFLGLTDFEDKQWDTAERHFLETISSSATDVIPLANFYLGLIYYKTGYSTGAIRGLRYAREGVEGWKNSSDDELKKTSEEVAETSKKLLKLMDRVQWFGNVTTMVQYDNNVALLPPAVNTQAQLNAKRTVKQIFTGGGGLITSPTRIFQAVPSYRMFFNYNYNGDAKNFDFFSHIPAVYVNYKPYMRLFPGAKIEGNYTFQNQAGRDATVEFHPYGLTGEIGPYARYEVNPHLFVQLDAFYKPKKYYGDPAQGADRRSGDGYIFRGNVDYTSPSRYLNPTGYVSAEKDRAVGKNWESFTFALGFNNVMKVDPINIVTVGFDVAFAHFSERVPERHDTTYSTRILWSHLLTRHFSFLADFNFVSDRSDIETLFAYNRAFGGVGLNYEF